MAKTDAPMEKTDEYSKGYTTVPAPATNKTSPVPAAPKDTQPMPMGARRVWNKVRPVPGGRPTPAKPQKTLAPPDTTPVHHGAGYDDPTGIKSPTADLNGMTKKRKL